MLSHSKDVIPNSTKLVAGSAPETAASDAPVRWYVYRAIAREAACRMFSRDSYLAATDSEDRGKGGATLLESNTCGSSHGVSVFRNPVISHVTAFPQVP